MQHKPREQEALTAYFKLLHNKGAGADNLKLREQFLNRLLPAISALPTDGPLYRAAVEQVIAHVDHADWPFFLSVVREYFHFWTKDIKAIAAMNVDDGFDLDPIALPPVEGDLRTLWNNLDSEKFTTVENWPLKAYAHALREEGAEQSLVDTRIKLVKLIIVRMRNAPELNNRHYRFAVDSMLPLFKTRKTRDLFVLVVREFFYFWIGDPDASTYIIVDHQTLA